MDQTCDAVAGACIIMLLCIGACSMCACISSTACTLTTALPELFKDVALTYSPLLSYPLNAIRFLVALRRLHPLELFLYAGSFFPRAAPQPYDLTNLSEFSSHFTVVQYRGMLPYTVGWKEFVAEFDAQHAPGERVHEQAGRHRDTEGSITS